MQPANIRLPRKKVGNKREKDSIGTITITCIEHIASMLKIDFRVRIIIGNTGPLDGSLKAMKKCGACYLAIVGGAAVSCPFVKREGKECPRFL